MEGGTSRDQGCRGASFKKECFLLESFLFRAAHLEVLAVLYKKRPGSISPVL